MFFSKLPASTRQTFSFLTTDRLYNCLTSAVKDLTGCASARAANSKRSLRVHYVYTTRVHYVSRVDRIPAAGRQRVGAHSGSEHLVDDGIMRLAGLDDLLVFFRRTGRRGGPFTPIHSLRRKAPKRIGCIHALQMMYDVWREMNRAS